MSWEIYKGNEIQIKKETHKTSAYIGKNENARYIIEINGRWLGVKNSQKNAIKYAKVFIDENYEHFKRIPKRLRCGSGSISE